MTILPMPGTTVRRVLPSVRALILMSMLTAGGAVAQSIKPGDIAPFEVVYEVGNNLISAGTARLTLSVADDVWSYSLTTKPKGVFKLAGKGYISEQSIFRLTDAGDEVLLEPQSYRYRQDDERRRAVDASFDWDKRTLTHMYRGTETTESLDAPVLDRLTVTLLIMNALRNDFDGAEISVFDSGEIKQVRFVNEGIEVLKTPLGKIDTFRVTNRNASGGSRETATWIAPSLDYLPVKIEHRKRGELVARLSLLRLENRVTSLELGEALPVEEATDDEDATD